MRDLTAGERLWLFAHRKGWSYRKVAEHFGVSPNKVTRWMRGKGDDIPEVQVDVYPLSSAEIITLARKRMGWDLATAASHMGISRQTLIKRESGRGEVEIMLTWWRRLYPEVMAGRGHSQTSTG